MGKSQSKLPIDKEHDKAIRILAELEKRRQRTAQLDYDKLLFPQQKSFILDPAKNKAAVCSRRAGKSTSVAVYALKTAIKYELCMIPYITLTKQQAYDIMWPAMQALDRKLTLGLDFNKNRLEITTPNGSRIALKGADDKAELERLRGPAYPLVLLDECQSFRSYLQDFIEDILEPATLDYDGTIVMTGTPGPNPTGFFYEASTKPKSGWSIHHWTLLDNPYLKNPGKWLEARKAKYGWTDETPRYQREYRGLWVPDTDAMVYKFRPDINTVGGIDPNEFEWYYVLGIDLGYADSTRQGEQTGSTAFVVLAYSEESHQVVVMESYTASNLIPSAVAAHVERLQVKYPFSAIVADAGGFGKGYVEEMKQRYQLPVLAAEKSQKAAFIEYMNGDFTSGVLKIIPEENAELVHEIQLLQWNEDRTSPDKTRYNDHLCDALLYGWRYCKQYLHEPEVNPPTYGSKEWYEKVCEKMEKEALRELSHAQGRSWWDTSPTPESDESPSWWDN